ncbi:XRE family transcriptional regulator [Salmonella enterica subsp. enterica serovar Montevideo]|nr:XRE family transcriptional regulator [Salmonella enterica subsp. enterica serovar Montevideo]KAA6658862.1 XRE family transcriptional regulator [Salmonella enterica subsp. enterica serovar Montevideo]KAA6669291.1 XRE family transcriptional regulator [Salmonella enterica subsp. enterica serovar Montevideo]KAA6686558.1 XRE family transcriptional regulator [Salmonella enterica subsp. enterica serovar Montevideo]KAA7169912.1 XRE family transcriptional regulator [Salmonella enterica subsp. enteric
MDRTAVRTINPITINNLIKAATVIFRFGAVPVKTTVSWYGIKRTIANLYKCNFNFWLFHLRRSVAVGDENYNTKLIRCATLYRNIFNLVRYTISRVYSPGKQPRSYVMKPQPTEFSTRLRETMRAKGIMQIEMAQRCGVTQSAISHLCCGRNNIADVTLLFKMADVLEVDPRWLAEGE